VQKASTFFWMAFKCKQGAASSFSQYITNCSSVPNYRKLLEPENNDFAEILHEKHNLSLKV
jgi:hypothetical protein